MSEKHHKKRKIKPGELQSVLASEEVMRRNVRSVMRFSEDTRIMVKELRVFFDTLQNNVMNLKNDVDELRRQLAILQQMNCSKGTKRYSDDDKR